MPDDLPAVLRAVLRTDDPARVTLRWYGDASGKEDLDALEFEWHVFALIGINESADRFREWNEIVRRDFGGHVHCGDRERRPSCALINRTLRAELPDWVELNIVLNRVYTAWVRGQMEDRGIRDVNGNWASSHFWVMMTKKAFDIAGVMRQLSGASHPLQHMSGVVLNNRADRNSEHSSEDIIRGVLDPLLPDGRLQFDGGDAPWLGLADMYAWATRQILVPPHRRPQGYSPDALWDGVPARRIRWHFPGWPNMARGFYPTNPQEVVVAAELIEHQYREVNRLILPSDLMNRVGRYRREGWLDRMGQSEGL